MKVFNLIRLTIIVVLCYMALMYMYRSHIEELYNEPSEPFGYEFFMEE